MKGKILDFSIQTNSGIISGEDNRRYQFTGSEWKEQSIPQRGTEVDFENTEDGNALGVYLALENSVSSQPVTPTIPAPVVPAKAVQQPQAITQTPVIQQQATNPGKDGKPEEQYNPWDWYQKGFKNFTNFNGRARRKEFWFFQMIAAIAFSCIALVSFLFAGVFSLIILLPSLAVSVRRLHDTGRSGWLALVGLIPFVGILVLIYWWAQDSEIQANTYGAVPK